MPRPLATRDLATSATMAFQTNDAEDIAAQAAARRTWRELATAYWQSTATDTEKERKAQPKFHRTKAYEWLVATSHMLMVATGGRTGVGLGKTCVQFVVGCTYCAILLWAIRVGYTALFLRVLLWSFPTHPLSPIPSPSPSIPNVPTT